MTAVDIGLQQGHSSQIEGLPEFPPVHRTVTKARVILLQRSDEPVTSCRAGGIWGRSALAGYLAQCARLCVTQASTR